MLRDCAWCGLPMEFVREYTTRLPAVVDGRLLLSGGGTMAMVQATCLGGHWYGGPRADVVEEA